MDQDQQRDYLEERDAQHLPHAEAGYTWADCPCPPLTTEQGEYFHGDVLAHIFEASKALPTRDEFDIGYNRGLADAVKIIRKGQT